MKLELAHLVALGTYLVAFLAAIVGLSVWCRRQRDERWPVETKLRRASGESLRRRIDKLWEDFYGILLAAALGPPLLGTGVLWFLERTAPLTSLGVALSIAGTVTLAGLIITGSWTMRYLRNIANHRLGYFGERVVAECLEPLLFHGYRVFHDIPMEGRTWKANIDHVVVGRTGVTVIETKAIRKRRGRPGRKPHVLDCSGATLNWPWGQGRVGLDQCVRNAEWLQRWIKARLNLDVIVTPILTFPGWYIEPPENRHFVVPTTWLSTAVPKLRGTLLTDDQVELIALQLDSLCRDVEE